MVRVITLVASLLAAVSAQAQMRGGAGTPAIHELKMFLRVAQLTPDQKTKVQDLMRTSRETVRPLFKQLHALREQLADKLASPGVVGPADLTPLQQQVAQLREQVDQHFTQTALQIRGLLTVDQLNKISQTYQRMKELRMEMRNLVTPPGEMPQGPEMGSAEEGESAAQ